jgi:predicted dehydrogenase
MSKTYRVGVIGLIHDHVWSNLDELDALSNGVLAAVADPNQPLLDKVRAAHDCATYLDYEKMVEKENLDAVYVYSDNASGAKQAKWALERGVHVMIEKPMAATPQGADAMVQTARERGLVLMVNGPFAWWQQLQYAVKIALHGDLGTLWQVRYRAAHAGPKEMGCSEYFCDWLYDAGRNGAGALMDYCCYGCTMASVLLGMPEKVVGVTGRLRKDDIDVEDNAIIVMSYPKAMAYAEASWTQIGKLSGYITCIYGAEATLEVGPKGTRWLRMATSEKPEGFEIDVPVPEPHNASAGAHFIWAIDTGGELLPLCRPEHWREAQHILALGLASAGN